MDCQNFKQLSLAPLSSDSLRQAENAMAVIRHRYPNFSSLLPPDSSSEYSPKASDFVNESLEPYTPDSWKILANTIAMFPQGELQLQYRPLLRGDSVDEAVVENYLALLRSKSLSVCISNVRYVKGKSCKIQNEGFDRPTIVPLRDEKAWAFVVAYSDCIHYYDSRRNGSLINIFDESSRTVETCWTGPKEQFEEDSGVYMLLGIRRIQQGTTHLSQEAAEELVESFRLRLAIELLCQKIDPCEEEIQALSNIILHGDSKNSVSASQFPRNDADLDTLMGQSILEYHGSSNDLVAPYIHHTNPSVEQNSPVVFADSYSPILQGPQSTPPTRQSTPAVNTTNFDEVTSSRSNILEGHVAQHSPVASSRQNVPRRKAPISRLPQRVVRSVTVRDSNFNSILNLLSAAAFECRYSGASKKTNLIILWHLVKKGRLQSQFHERYNAVLFYTRMESLGDDDVKSEMNGYVDLAEMRRIQTQSKFWHRVCNIGDWGIHKYVLLLAIPALSARLKPQEEDRIISELEARLEDTSDKLMHWLWSARELCAAIITRSLPEENLMIDLYHMKRLNDITESTYMSFVSTNPHEKMPISFI